MIPVLHAAGHQAIKRFVVGVKSFLIDQSPFTELLYRDFFIIHLADHFTECASDRCNGFSDTDIFRTGKNHTDSPPLGEKSNGFHKMVSFVTFFKKVTIVIFKYIYYTASR